MIDGSGWTVIMAVFNEEESIRGTLEDLAAHMPEGTEVLVIDGGRDGTVDVVKDVSKTMPGVRHVVHADDRGKGHAIRTGMGMAGGRVQLQFDGDGQFFAEDLRKLGDVVETGRADVVLGSRFMKVSGKDKDAGRVRSLGNFIVSTWASLLFGHRMTDVMAGSKAWSAEAAGKILLTSDTYEYEVEIPCRALKAGLRVVDVAISTRARELGVSKVPVVRMGIKVLLATWRFRWS